MGSQRRSREGFKDPNNAMNCIITSEPDSTAHEHREADLQRKNNELTLQNQQLDTFLRREEASTAQLCAEAVFSEVLMDSLPVVIWGCRGE